MEQGSIFAVHWQGGLAQLARALAWHARGHQFESGILHSIKKAVSAGSSFFIPLRFKVND